MNANLPPVFPYKTALEKLRTADWAYDNLVPTTIPNVITTGQVSPNYTVNVIRLSLSYRF